MAVWWKEQVVYQIYPRSFQDSNGDGIGDIPGIISHLDDLKDLGVGVLWLSPVYRSPNADNGYDISDYRDINPEYGTLSDMKKLISEAKKRGIRIIMDLVINHTSDEHEWFQKSRRREKGYEDYYIWKPAREDGKLPNNWTSFFAEDAWEFDDVRGEYYLHLFAKKQPDLNYYNPKILEEVKGIMQFWLDMGIAGFRCDVINILYKSSLGDAKKRAALTGMEYYISQEGTHEILRTLRREVLDRYDCFTVGESVMVTTKLARDLCDESRKELSMVFGFEHMNVDCFGIKYFPRSFSAKRFGKVITKWQNELSWNANYLENHDQPRSVPRFGDENKYWAESAKLLGLMLLSLRGTPYVYQGEEIGMLNFDYESMNQVDDVESKNVYKLLDRFGVPDSIKWKMIKRASRDNARTPVQWTDGKNAGFTEGTPWLGVNTNYKRINYAAQKNDEHSILSFYKKMIEFRKGSEVLINGTFKEREISKNIFAYERALGEEKLLVVLNFSSKNRTVDYRGEVVFSNTERRIFNGTMFPYEAVILKEGKATE